MAITFDYKVNVLGLNYQNGSNKINLFSNFVLDAGLTGLVILGVANLNAVEI